MRGTIDHLLKADPFVPFVFAMNSGDRYEARNPRMAIVERDVVTRYRFRSNRWDVLRLAEVCSVEVLEPDE